MLAKELSYAPAVPNVLLNLLRGVHRAEQITYFFAYVFSLQLKFIGMQGEKF